MRSLFWHLDPYRIDEKNVFSPFHVLKKYENIKLVGDFSFTFQLILLLKEVRSPPNVEFKDTVSKLVMKNFLSLVMSGVIITRIVPRM